MEYFYSPLDGMLVHHRVIPQHYLAAAYLYTWPRLFNSRLLNSLIDKFQIGENLNQRLDNAIHRINHYPADSVVCFCNTYPLNSDLSGG